MPEAASAHLDRRESDATEASGELETVLDALMKTGVYGASRDKALIACFAKWFDLNRARERGIKLKILD